VLWVRSDLGITLAGSKVSAWADQSGSGNDVAQAVDANRPLYVAGAIPTVDFDETHPDFLGIASPLRATTAYTMAAVTSAAATNAYETVCQDYNDGAGIVPRGPTPGTWAQHHRNLGDFYTTEAVAAGRHSVLISHAGGASTVARVVVDGTAYTGVLAANPAPSTGFTIGAREDGSNPGTLSLAELIVLNRQLSVAEEAAWNAYALGRYGV
jgi:hypothetical protein